MVWLIIRMVGNSPKQWDRIVRGKRRKVDTGPMILGSLLRSAKGGSGGIFSKRSHSRGAKTIRDDAKVLLSSRCIPVSYNPLPASTGGFTGDPEPGLSQIFIILAKKRIAYVNNWAAVLCIHNSQIARLKGASHRIRPYSRCLFALKSDQCESCRKIYTLRPRLQPRNHHCPLTLINPNTFFAFHRYNPPLCFSFERLMPMDRGAASVIK